MADSGMGSPFELGFVGVISVVSIVWVLWNLSGCPVGAEHYVIQRIGALWSRFGRSRVLCLLIGLFLYDVL